MFYSRTGDAGELHEGRSRPALRTYHEHDDKVHAHILIARYAHRTTMARGPALLLDTRHFSRSSHSTIPIKHPTNHFHHLHFPGPSNVQGGLSFRQPYNRAGERFSRFSRRGSSAESSEVCILDHRLLSAHAMRLPCAKTAALTRHSTSRRHAASRTPRPPCCAYPNWKGSSGPWKKALSSAFSLGYHLTSRFSKSAK